MAYDYECPVDRCGFVSSGHETQKAARARGKEHQAEHDTGEPMREIAEFMADGGDK